MAQAEPRPSRRAKVLPFPGAGRRAAATARTRDELAFLPAALEIVETPASPAGRGIALTICAAFALALAWACWGEVDIVAVAPGKVIPSDRTKTIQPFETGVVRAIRVQDGQAVKAGDVLIELDPTINAAEREHLASDLIAARLDVARLKAALAAVAAGPRSAPESFFVSPEGAPSVLASVQRQLLADQIAEQRAKAAALERQQTQREAERTTAVAQIAKLTAAIPLLRQRVDVRKYLADREYGSKLSWLELQQDLVEHEHDLEVQRSRLAETEAALATIVEQRRQTEAEFRRTVLGDLAQAEQKAAGLVQDFVKAQERTRLQVLTAPVDGTVQQLQVTTVGGVVTPAQALMVVVPAESRLEIEAMIPNKDIGFVEAGQGAEIKVDTFNFTKYGMIHGTVLSVSGDAVARNRPPDDKADPTAPATAAAPGGNQELVYAARVALDRTTMTVENGKTVNLSPGMAVTVEIKTGARRIIEYVFSPLLKYRQESMRER